ncbi:hypothetical protein V1264_007184 [Littorina saxatilis]|uniref:procollagen-proline 4-dioxygenase n=3 Tax=Littorina saxatilis TaxID=31220 RepID=A0AAN9G3E8_9CAEN
MNKLLPTLFVILAVMTSCGVGEIYTSSDKILELVSRETTLLDALQSHINAEYDNLKALSGFLSERSKATRTASYDDLKLQAEHPNGAYHLIKLYTQDWHHIVMANPLFDKHISHLKPKLPTSDDFRGACSAIVRLHRMYKLRVDDMYTGNYSGYLGPRLTPDDAFEIGRQAFVDGFLEESSDWLKVAVEKLAEQDGTRGQTQYTMSKRGQACGLLGRAFYFMNNTDRATELYNMGRHLDSSSGDILQLQKELQSQISTDVYGSATEVWHDNMTELCMWDKSKRVEQLRPFHFCRYKVALFSLPYIRYKEEILSVAPFVSVFYEMVSDKEIDTITTYVKGRMYRGLVGMGENATTAYIRTSDLGWMYDDELEIATRVSERVKSITGLEVAQRTPDGPSSSEAFQIVNYGMGGHYDVHMDPFDHTPDDNLLNRSGERLATFLIYLSDVKKGGNTVFVRSKISVAPQKGMALFWYNFDPSMKKDLQTHHAGCPVIIGHKWIANKWIWTYGNTFRRKCGPRPSSKQLDIEPLMYSSHKHCTRH